MPTIECMHERMQPEHDYCPDCGETQTAESRVIRTLRTRVERAEAALRELGKHPESCGDDCVSELARQDALAELAALRDKALRFDLDQAGIARRDADAAELVELRAELAALRAELEVFREREAATAQGVRWLESESKRIERRAERAETEAAGADGGRMTHDGRRGMEAALAAAGVEEMVREAVRKTADAAFVALGETTETTVKGGSA